MKIITRADIANVIGVYFAVPQKTDDSTSLEYLTTEDIICRTFQINPPVSPVQKDRFSKALTSMGFKKYPVRKDNKPRKLWRVKFNADSNPIADMLSPKTKKFTTDATKFILAGVRCLFGSNRIIDLAFQGDRNDPASEFRRELEDIFDRKREQVHNIISIAFALEYAEVKLYEMLTNKLLEQNTRMVGLLRDGKSKPIIEIAKYFPRLNDVKTAYLTDMYCLNAVLAAFDEYEQSLEDIDQSDLKVS